jgi:hypothetical protein
MPEVVFTSALPSPKSLFAAFRFVFPDEANAFDRVLGHLTGPGGGRLFKDSGEEAVGARIALLIRRRPGVRRGAFKRFVHDELGAALARAPATRELHTHAFLPYSRLTWPTPGVAHDNPPHRRYHGAVVLGTDSRPDLDELFRSREVSETRDAQAQHCVALHAYAVEETVVVVEDGRPKL